MKQLVSHSLCGGNEIKLLAHPYGVTLVKFGGGNGSGRLTRGLLQ